MGIISAIGKDLHTNLDSLCEEKRELEKCNWLSSAHEPSIAGRRSKTTVMRTWLPSRGLSPKLPRTAFLSCIAAREALNMQDGEKGNRCAPDLFLPIQWVAWTKQKISYKLFSKNTSAGKLADVVNHECGAVTELVAGFLGIRHFVSTVSTACSSSANAIFTGARMIRAGLLDFALVGGADALTRFTLNGFNTLMILDKELCKPFDENRRGLNLGEGAAYLLLASEKGLRQLRKKPIARISGYANANDAFHQTASSPEGTGSFLAMKGALEKAGLQRLILIISTCMERAHKTMILQKEQLYDYYLIPGFQR